MGRTSLRPWFMGNKMQFEAVACRLFLHYSYTLAQKASNYGIFCFYNKEKRLFHSRDAASPIAWNGFGGICRRELFEIQNTAYGEETHDFAVSC